MGDLQTAALVGALALGGVLVWRELDRKHETAAANGAAGAQLPGASTQAPGGLLGGTLPPGTTAPAGGVAGQLDELRRAQEAAQKQAQIEMLTRDLARIHNDMDVLVVQAQSIKAQTPPADFTKAIADREWAACREGTSFGWVVCNDGRVPPRITAAVAAEWGTKIANDLKPIQAQLSRLNAEQQATVANLGRLGYVVPLAQTKQVTV